MADVLFISETYFKRLAGVDGNVDWKKLESTVIAVQDIYIEQILGTPLYNDLKTKITADPTMSTYPNEKDLIDEYIAKALAWYIKMEASLDFKFAYQNKGIMVKSSDNSSAADTSDIKYLKDNWRKNAETYSERLTKHLLLNTTTFPKYAERTLDGVNPNVRNFTVPCALRNYSYKSDCGLKSPNDSDNYIC
jgi:hypothetical protein